VLAQACNSGLTLQTPELFTMPQLADPLWRQMERWLGGRTSLVMLGMSRKVQPLLGLYARLAFKMA